MKNKGVSLVSLSIVIVVFLILISTISISITYSMNNAKKMTFAKEIYNIQNMVNEYVKKEGTLPRSISAIQVQPSDLEQFDGEILTNNSLVLDVLDLTELGIKNTSYGNGELGNTDVYAISQTTYKVYYIAGFKANDKTYYTLTDELLNIIDRKQQLVIGEKAILFIPDKQGWVNEGITVTVNVPKDYDVTSFTINNTNISYTMETGTDGTYYNVNTEKLVGNYTITVNYTKDGVSGTVSYTSKVDITLPQITKNQKQNNVAILLDAVDNESGIKHFKYVEGAINNDETVKTYMKAYGKDIKKSSLKYENKTVYTIYAEDRAGNYTVRYINENGEIVSNI